jgi:phosphate starvation-inducible protein PhoH
MATKSRAHKQSNQPRQFRNIFDSINISIKTIKPLTDNQALAFEGFEKGKCMLLLGSAGSGKSYQAIYHGLKDIEKGKARKLIIVRSAVPTRDQGYLPGSLADKEEAYTLPYQGIVNDLFGRDDAWGLMRKHGIIEFMSTSYIRGITLDNCVIVFDECQSASLNELITIITRAGKNTVVHYTGDYAQSDLKNKERVLSKFTTILELMPEFCTICFSINDCVRSGLARSFLLAQHKVYGDEVII